MNPIVVCADIGSVAQEKFAWLAEDGKEGTRLTTLAEHVAELLNDKHTVALGFECPLFIPLWDEELNITSARPGEGNRPWSAGARCTLLASGLTEVAWVLRSVRGRLSTPTRAYLDWDAFAKAGSGLLIWEALVSGSGKGRDHIEDARAGVEAFRRTLPTPQSSLEVGGPLEIYSLIGAALLRTGWSTDFRLLSMPCLLIKA